MLNASPIVWHDVKKQLPSEERQLLLSIEGEEETKTGYPHIVDIDPSNFVMPGIKSEDDIDFSKLDINFFGEGGKRIDNVTAWAYMPKPYRGE